MLKHSADRARTVTADDTAAAWGDAFPPAASTPFVLGLAEVACHELVADRLADDEITVGVAAEIEHLAPSAIGASLVASPRLTSESGRALEFAVDQPPNAPRAAATARSTSSGVATGTSAIVSPVAGLSTFSMAAEAIRSAGGWASVRSPTCEDARRGPDT